MQEMAPVAPAAKPRGVERRARFGPEVRVPVRPLTRPSSLECACVRCCAQPAAAVHACAGAILAVAFAATQRSVHSAVARASSAAVAS